MVCFIGFRCPIRNLHNFGFLLATKKFQVFSCSSFINHMISIINIPMDLLADITGTSFFDILWWCYATWLRSYWPRQSSYGKSACSLSMAIIISCPAKELKEQPIISDQLQWFPLIITRIILNFVTWVPVLDFCLGGETTTKV